MQQVGEQPSATSSGRRARGAGEPLSSGASVRTAAGLLLLVLVAVALRGHNLGWPPLWADEAESTLNALTILGTGLPRDRYLDLPLYENVLVEPWPGNEEYAFRDISYSDRGLVVYHGWVPLYAIAAAFRLAGVTPEAARRAPPVADATRDELVRWTAVPRAPALVFSALLVLCAFGLGSRTGGEGVGWAMALGCAAGGIFVWFGRQARYYSPALAVAALCGFAIWGACRRGRLRDHLLAGLSLALAFHTHALTAVAAGALYVLAWGVLPRQRPRRLRGLLAGGAVAAALVLPWAAWSGFLGLRQRVPAAHRLVDPGTLLHSLPSTDPVVLAALLVPLGALVALLAGVRGRLPERVGAALAERGPAVAFAALWLVLSWASFVLFVPAASYFGLRLKLMVAVPGLLLLCLVLAASARVLRPSAPAWTVPVVLLLLLVAARQLPPQLQAARAVSGEHELVRLLRSWPLEPGARVYAVPANQFALTYYTGLPVQNVSAVRRSWLEHFPGDLVIVDGRWYEPLGVDEVTRIARVHGVPLAPEEASRLAQQAVRRATEQALAADGYKVERPLPPPGPLDQALLQATRRATAALLDQALRGTPLARTARFEHWGEFWRFFFFWFAGPEQHLGENLNFRGRALRGRVHVLENGWSVYDCRPGNGRTPLVAEGRSAMLE